jgi:uncharacterized Rossmann fold enzyme
MEHPMPTPEEQEKALSLTWNRLAGITTQTATPSSESMDNVRFNIDRTLPWFHSRFPIMQEEHRIPGKRIALIGGGPSIKDTVSELRDFDVTIACGSSHDWLQANMHRPPTFCAVCDPDPVMANYMLAPDKDTKYLISSHCNPAVFDALNGYDITMWHCWPIGAGDQEARDYLQEKTPGWIAIGGGCTVGLRSLTIAMMLGYTEIHFFGFDSCMGMTDDDHHAYPFTDSTKEFLGDIYNVKIGMGTGENDGPQPREYRVAGYQLAQAEHYKQMLQAFGHLFKPVFHGPGLLADMQAMINIEAQRLLREELSK